MPNVYVNLPMPVFDGAGAAVDVSAMGKNKTLAVTGNMADAVIEIQGSGDAGVSWAPIATFTRPEVESERQVVAEQMRVFVRRRPSNLAFSAVCNVGGDPGGMAAIVPAIPVSNGSGAASSGALLGSFKTILCSGSFGGARVLVEGSNDAGVTWAPIAMFTGKGGVETLVDVCQTYRVSVTGRTGLSFTCAVAIAAANDPQTSAGSLSNVQAFTYIATGIEGTAFDVPIPVAQPDALYTPWYALYDVENHVTISFPIAGRTTLLLPVELSAPLTDGDTIRFILANTP